MSAVQDTAKERQRENRGGFPWPWSWHCPLFDEPLPLIGYVTGVLACYLAFTGWEAARTPLTSGDLALFAALMCCGAICVEASGRLGQPTGVWRDLLSAWWLPVALLLPPLYALAAPAVLGLLSYLRVAPRRGVPEGVQQRGARPGRRARLGPVPLAHPGGAAGPGRGLADLPGAERVAAAPAAGGGGDRLRRRLRAC